MISWFFGEKRCYCVETTWALFYWQGKDHYALSTSNHLFSSEMWIATGISLMLFLLLLGNFTGSLMTWRFLSTKNHWFWLVLLFLMVPALVVHTCVCLDLWWQNPMYVLSLINTLNWKVLYSHMSKHQETSIWEHKILL